MAGTTNVSRYIRGIRDIGFRDAEVVLSLDITMKITKYLISLPLYLAYS